MPSIESAKPSNNSAKQANGWGKYFQENTLKIAGSLMLFLGGLFVLTYFGHVEFLPEIDLTNATSLLASVALVGAFFVFILAGVFVAPGLFLHYLVSTGLLAHPESKNLSADIANATDSESSKSEVADREAYRVLVRTSSWASVVAGSIQVGALLLASWELEEEIHPLLKDFQHNLYGALFVVALVLLAWAVWKLHRNKGLLESTSKTDSKQTGKPVWSSYIALGSLWFVIGAIPLLPFAAAYSGSDGWIGWGYLWIWLIWIGVSNSLWGCERTEVKWWLVGVIGLFSLYILALITSNPSIVSVSAVRALGLGGVEDVTLVVRKDGCQAIARTAGNAACSTEGNSEPFVTDKVTLLSRIGSQYLIEACADNGEMIRIVLDKKDVIGWAAPASKKPKKDKKEEESKQEGGSKMQGQGKNSSLGKCQPRNLRGTSNSDSDKTTSAPNPRVETPTINISIDGKVVGNNVSIGNGSLHFHLSPEFKAELSAAIKNEIRLGLSVRYQRSSSSTTNTRNHQTNNYYLSKPQPRLPVNSCGCIEMECQRLADSKCRTPQTISEVTKPALQGQESMDGQATAPVR